MRRLLLLLLLLPACVPPLSTPANAQLACTAAADCPADSACLVDEGVCVLANSGCAETSAGLAQAINDGDACTQAGGARGLCNRGLCRPSTCGDEIVDKLAGEECDEGDDNGEADASCSSSCRVPVCGDGVIDARESCDGEVFANGACEDCVIACSDGFGDCNADLIDGCECVVVEAIGEDTALPLPEEVFILGSPRLTSAGSTLVIADFGTVLALEEGANALSLLRLGETFGFTSVVASDGARIYFNEDGVIRSIALAGGGEEAVVTVELPPLVLAVDADSVYVPQLPLMFRAPKRPVAEPVFRVMLRISSTTAVAVDDDGFYACDEEELTVRRFSKEGPISDQLTFCVPGDGSCAADESCTAVDDNFFCLPAGAVIADGQDQPRGLAAAGGFVYWGTRDGAVRRVPRDGGDVEDLAVVGLDARALFVRDDEVWVQSTDELDGLHTIHRVRAGRASPIAHLPDITSFAVVGETVWVVSATGIFRAGQ